MASGLGAPTGAVTVPAATAATQANGKRRREVLYVLTRKTIHKEYIYFIMNIVNNEIVVLLYLVLEYN